MRNIGHPAAKVARFLRDSRANAAVEFAFVVPLMLALFFGTVEFSSGVAASRKVTLVARTLSDLVSQSSTVTSDDVTNFNTTGKAIMSPYSTTDLQTRVTSLYIDPTTKVGKVKWSKGSGMSDLSSTDTVTVPTALQVGDTYLVYSEVKYKYVPAVGYMMAKDGVALSDATYTRPRQSLCVKFGSSATC